MKSDPSQGWTKTPNEILDAMPEMSEAELKLTAVLVRLTYGYHRQEVKMTYEDMKNQANLSQGGVSNAITAVNERGFFTRGNKSMWYANCLPGRQNDTPEDVQELDDSLLSRQNEEEQTVYPVDKNNLLSRQKSIDESLPSRQSQSYKEKEGKEKEEKPFPFQPLPENLKRPTPAQQRVDAILEVCGLLADVPAHISQAENAAAQIRDVSAGYILDRYRPGQHPDGHWYWYSDDWRGQKGNMPTPKQVVETIALKLVKQRDGPTRSEAIVVNEDGTY